VVGIDKNKCERHIYSYQFYLTKIYKKSQALRREETNLYLSSQRRILIHLQLDFFYSVIVLKFVRLRILHSLVYLHKFQKSKK
jgi:hypothetical protein